MYNSIRKELGFKDDLHHLNQHLNDLASIDAIAKELRKLTGKEAVVIRGLRFMIHDGFAGADFARIVVGNIKANKHEQYSNDASFGEGLYDLLDVVPAETLKEGGELHAYTFYGHSCDTDEYIMAVHDNPAAAFLAALPKAQSRVLRLEQIDEIKPGLLFRSEKHYKEGA